MLAWAVYGSNLARNAWHHQPHGAHMHYVSIMPAPINGRTVPVATLTGSRAGKVALLVCFPAYLTGGRMPSVKQALAYLRTATPF